MCTVSIGDNPLEFSWFFNGKKIVSQPDISISINKRRSTLDIESVNAAHSGEYTCSVSNEAGAISHSTTLSVNGNQIKRLTLIARLLLRFLIQFNIFLSRLSSPCPFSRPLLNR